MKNRKVGCGLVVSVVTSCAICLAISFPGAAKAQASKSPHAALQQLLTHPVRGAARHEPRVANSWGDLSLDSFRRQNEQNQRTLAALRAIDRAELSPQDQLQYDRFEYALQQKIDAYHYRKYLIRPTTRSGIRFAAQAAERQRFAAVKNYEAWIDRLQQFGAHMDQYIALLQAGVKAGITQPREVIKGIRPQIAVQIVDDATKSQFYKPLQKMPDTISGQDKKRLRAAAKKAITDVVVPAFRKYLHYFTTVYLPHARPKIGLSTVPSGKAMYAFLARYYTTTDLTPLEIRKIGLKKVAQLHAEMERVMPATGFQGSYAEFLEYLRTSPQMYKSADQMLEGYRAAAKRVDPLLVTMFPVSLLPRVPYGVRPIAGGTAQDGFFAYSVPPARNWTVAGYMAINLGKATKRAKMDTQVLTCHEARPGHQLEIPIAMEAAGPGGRFRRFGRLTAFIEGWALYAETLCDEMGLYDTAYKQFAYLNYQMWRAVRLVVDTGIHSMGWTRQQAIDYFKANTSLDMEHITNEVDRYITNPGQALAYMIGETTIQKLRSKAEQVLGPKFDVRMFHCAVLRHGELPMSLLTRTVNDWIDKVKAGSPAASNPLACHVSRH